MKLIATADAVGHVLCHDFTQIIKGQYKDARFRKGHIVTEEDIPVLLSMGKENLYVWEKMPGMLHEDEAAARLGELCRNENMTFGEVKEGKIEIKATADGLLRVDTRRLAAINSLEDMMIATRHNYSPVKAGDKLAGTRIIPLVISEERLSAAEQLAEGRPLLELLPYQPLRAGIVTTGSEVFHGRIKDTFTPVLVDKLQACNIEVIAHELCDDGIENIAAAIGRLRRLNCSLILCTGGMSVDPDDNTPGAIARSGAQIVTYGAPVLPGAMFLLGYYADGVPVCGLPGCVMYAKATVFDIVLPRLRAGVRLSKQDFALLGEGGLCLSCPECRYPLCGYGK